MTLISKYLDIEPVETIRHWDTEERIEMTCPSIVGSYKSFMGGIDLHSYLVSPYKYSINSQRWYFYIFYHTIMIAVVNAWNLYRRHCKQVSLTAKKFGLFIAQLSYGLMNAEKNTRQTTVLARPHA